MTKVQKKFVKQFKAQQKVNGLKKVVFTLSGTNGSLDDVLRESFEIDKAIAAGKTTPLPDNF